MILPSDRISALGHYCRYSVSSERESIGLTPAAGLDPPSPPARPAPAPSSLSLKSSAAIPAVSYSSSDDDEDDFFDAQDDSSAAGASRQPSLLDTAGHGGSGRAVRCNIPILFSEDAGHGGAEVQVTPLTPSETDWDALYEEEEEEDDVDMKSHGSVITHLLSQVTS